jgi:hypothetical protein
MALLMCAMSEAEEDSKYRTYVLIDSLAPKVRKCSY